MLLRATRLIRAFYACQQRIGRTFALPEDLCLSRYVLYHVSLCSTMCQKIHNMQISELCQGHNEIAEFVASCRLIPLEIRRLLELEIVQGKQALEENI